jgi:hypothetical protein
MSLKTASSPSAVIGNLKSLKEAVYGAIETD